MSAMYYCAIINGLNVIESHLTHLVSDHDWLVLDSFNLEEAFNTNVASVFFFPAFCLP